QLERDLALELAIDRLVDDAHAAARRQLDDGETPGENAAGRELGQLGDPALFGEYSAGGIAQIRFAIHAANGIRSDGSTTRRAQPQRACGPPGGGLIGTGNAR